MKHIALILFAVLIIASLGTAQHKAGDFGILFTASKFFSDIGVSNINGGAGIRWFPVKAMSLRGTLGGTIVDSKEQAPPKNVATSLAALFQLAYTSNTELYVGPVAAYQHAEPNVNTYQIGGVLGAEVLFMDNVSLGAEYMLSVKRTSEPKVTVIDFGETSGQIILSVWF